MQTTFPEYVVALATIVGSIFFTIFGGVGIASLPLGLIFSFIRCPKAVITRSQYIKEATELGKKGRELRKAADAKATTNHGLVVLLCHPRPHCPSSPSMTSSSTTSPSRSRILKLGPRLQIEPYCSRTSPSRMTLQQAIAAHAAMVSHCRSLHHHHY
ncbi:uncharacterized protein LOC131167413 [Malania oleifera]|uniref:uncharacterized protein LOC131167413 n=1 Tax=Malania oleifera TaxID=397392 RepID=UPI0025AEBB75|nr:uncharacterized protein LOC131167413 [Malania oleifera]